MNIFNKIKNFFHIVTCEHNYDLIKEEKCIYEGWLRGRYYPQVKNKTYKCKICGDTCTFAEIFEDE